MGIEIERIFLVRGDDWRAGAQPVLCRQDYLTSGKDLTLRVRVLGEIAYLTIKGGTRGLTRAEYEYPIPMADADELLDRF